MKLRDLISSFLIVVSSLSFASDQATLLVGSAPGGAIDSTARLFAEYAKSRNVSITVENKPGAGHIVAAKHTIAAKADGSTLFMAVTTPITLGPALGKTDYDPLVSFTFISIISQNSPAMLLTKAGKFKSFKQLVSAGWTAEKPLKIAFSSESNKLVSEEFAKQYNLPVILVQYKGSSPLYVDIQNEQVDMSFDLSMASATALVLDQKLDMLATSSPVAKLPLVPTFKALGFTGYVPNIFIGLVGPAGMSQDKVNLFSGLIKDMLSDRDLEEKMSDAFGAPAKWGSGEQFKDLVKEETKKITSTVKR